MAAANSKKITVLAADIGGTKTHVGLYKPSSKRPRLVALQTYISKKYDCAEDIIRTFLSNHPSSPAAACIGIAGPVIEGICKATNLPWIVSVKKISKTFGWDAVILVNDLVTTAMAIPLLRRAEIAGLNGVLRRTKGRVGLVAPGTGFGQALLIPCGDGYEPVPSEGGHCDFAPINAEQLGLWKFLHRKYGHVSVERLLSGPGMFNIYLWLRETSRYKEPQWLAKELTSDEPARVIAQAAIVRGTPICKKTLQIFTSILGSVCGNLALTAMAKGGIYLGGGIPPKILSFLRGYDFLRVFTNKGRFSDLLESIPVGVILNEKAALLGAAHMASRSYCAHR